MSGLNVLIVGASIAGPSAAYWFAKTGSNVTVIERFPELRTNGQNVDIRTAGVSVMRKIPGMEASVRAKKAPIEGFSFVGSDGKPFGEIKPTGNPNQQSLVSEYEIYRGDLAKILYDLTKDHEKVKYVFGEQVSSIQQNEQDGGPVTVEFANGHPKTEYDLVVACDGATSRTRAMGFGSDVRDCIHPSNYWAAYCSIEQDIVEGAKIGQAYHAVRGRMIAAGPGRTRGNRVTFLCLNSKNDVNAMPPFREAMKGGDDALKQFVVKHYEGIGWRTDEILQGVLKSQDFYASEIVQVKLPKLYKGRFVAIGDAGHAAGFTGAGTTLAMTSAYILAGEISKHGNDIAAGLQGFEESFRPILTEMQKEPPLIAMFVAPQTAWGLWLRNTIFTLIARSGIIEFAMKYLAPAFANAEEYKLPEYQWAT